ncbi:hypothetical protein GB928_008205 [Shinella curvata]|uniref:DUF4148 domain-containing protein n=1 Tax=Shinella curvata TaxID=1817964 RepID=A0ABT8XBQ2_9HYPH|nr:hypothetical protein [Shinella curvata]MCJ8054140.1 hypothetical protein [Shinella curvata]MDO6121162.1 hypothetical protein [Shinella curvata]
MNKLAIAIAALSLSAGAAFAENPSLGRSDFQASQPAVDHSVTASIKSGNSDAVVAQQEVADTRARYGDGAPYAGR